jgi:hypothetical protein
VERDEIAMKRAARNAGASLCDTRIPWKSACAGGVGTVAAEALRHVVSTLFAPALCRKLANEATFSWHLPQCRNGNRRLRAAGHQSMCDAHNRILPSFRESARNDGEEEEKAGCQSACHGGRITAIRHDRCDAKYSAG